MTTADDLLRAAQAHAKDIAEHFRAHRPTDTPKERASIEAIADIVEKVVAGAFCEGYIYAVRGPRQ